MSMIIGSFIAGLFTGVIMGFCIFALVSINNRADQLMEQSEENLFGTLESKFDKRA